MIALLILVVKTRRHSSPSKKVLASVGVACLMFYLENYPSLTPANLFALIHISTTAASYL